MKLQELLGHRNYRAYALGSLLSLTGTWTQRVAIGWLAWELTGSAAWLGLLALADAAPLVALGIVGGTLSDRGNPVRLIRCTLALSTLCTVILTGLAFAGVASIAAIIALTFVNGVATAIGQPARMVLAPMLVPRGLLPAAVALGSASFNLARLVGPLVAGLLVAWQGVELALAFNAVSYAVFLAVLPTPAEMGDEPGRGQDKAVARHGAATREPHRERASTLATISTLARDPAIANVLLLTAVAAIGVRGYVELLPALAATLLSGGPTTLALLAAAAGAGALLGAGWMISDGDEAGLGRRCFASSALAAMMLLGLATIETLWLALLASIGLGLALVISATAAQSLIQLRAPPSSRGRAIGLYLTILRGGPALGALALGALADATALSPALAGAALATAAALLWVRSRDRMNTPQRACRQCSPDSPT